VATRDIVSRALVAIDAFDDLFQKAPRLPMSRDRRVDDTALRDAITELGDAVRAAVPGPRSATRVALAELEELVRRAPRVALGGGVRLSSGTVYEVLDRLVEALPRDVR
jgi:hypothetical protein